MKSKLIKIVAFLLSFLTLPSGFAAQIDEVLVENWWGRNISMPTETIKALFANQNNLQTGSLEAVYLAFGGSTPNSGTGPIFGEINVSALPPNPLVPVSSGIIYNDLQTVLSYFSNPPPANFGAGITNIQALVGPLPAPPWTIAQGLTVGIALIGYPGLGQSVQTCATNVLANDLNTSFLPPFVPAGPVDTSIHMAIQTIGYRLAQNGAISLAADVAALIGLIDAIHIPKPPAPAVFQNFTGYIISYDLLLVNGTLGTGSPTIGTSLGVLIGLTQPGQTLFVGISNANTLLGAGWTIPHGLNPPNDNYTKVFNLLTRLNAMSTAGYNIPAASASAVSIEAWLTAFGF